LCQENYLVKKQGKGTFVKHAKVARKIKYLLGFSKSCEANGMVPSRKVIKREIVELSDEDAKTMGLEAGSHAVSIERINLADGVPIMYEINLFPYQKFAFLLEEPLDGSLFELLEKKCHTIVSYSNNSYLDLARASGRIAKELRVPNREPLFFLYSEGYDSNNELVYIGKDYVLADQYRFYLDDPK